MLLIEMECQDTTICPNKKSPGADSFGAVVSKYVNPKSLGMFAPPNLSDCALGVQNAAAY
jgi:hypothetical protein